MVVLRAHERQLAWLVGAVAVGYAGVRAATVSISHDEALTFLIHVPGSLRDIFLHDLRIHSNNHLLNTLLIKGLSSWLGGSELVLRLPALLGYVLYLVGSYRMLRLFGSGALVVGALALLASNPFLVDFFSCARGYGLGVGLAMVGGFHFLRGAGSRSAPSDPRDTVRAIAAMTLAVLANLSFLNLYLAWLGVAATGAFVDGVRRVGPVAAARCLARQMFLPVLTSAALLGVVYNPPVAQRIRLAAGGWGGSQGFWADTVQSLIQASYYGQPYASAPLIGLTKAVVLVIVMVAVVDAVWTGLAASAAPEAWHRARLTGVLVLVGSGVWLQFLLLGVRFPIERAALYLIPLFLVLAVAVLARARWALWGLLVLLLAHAIACVNVSRFYSWGYDASTKAAMAEVEALTSHSRAGARYSLGISWQLEPSTNYYIVRRGLSWIEPTNRGGPGGEHNLYYVLGSDRPRLATYDLEILTVYPVSDTYLAVPRAGQLRRRPGNAPTPGTR